MAHHTPVAEAPQLMASEAATQIGELTEKWQMIVSHHLCLAFGEHMTVPWHWVKKV